MMCILLVNPDSMGIPVSSHDGMMVLAEGGKMSHQWKKIPAITTMMLILLVAPDLCVPETVTLGRGRNQLVIDSQEGRRGRLESGLDIHYNRVDGLYVQLGVDTNWKPPALLRFFAHGGYAFQGKAWRYEIGLERWLQLGPAHLTLGIRNYDLTHTEDEWLLPTVENSAAAFFFREDFMDYYRVTGTRFQLRADLFCFLNVELAYLLDEHESLKRNTNWSLFGGDKKFRDNPSATEGSVHSLLFRLGYDSRDDFMEPASGFLIEAVYEKAGEEFGGQLDFDRFLLDLRRYLYLTRYENIDFRFRLGSASGDVPDQKAFDLGGLGSLRGYKHKEFRDFDRMVLGNLEYRIGLGRLSSRWMEDHQIIPFYDFGLAWASNDTGSLIAGFDQLKARRIKTSVGIGFSTGPGDRLRINVARRLDDHDEPLVVTVRIHRIF
jgi:hypothetical protein